MSYAELSYFDLRCAKMKFIELSHAEFGYAELSFAELSNAELSYAKLNIIELSGLASPTFLVLVCACAEHHNHHHIHYTIISTITTKYIFDQHKPKPYYHHLDRYPHQVSQ